MNWRRGKRERKEEGRVRGSRDITRDSSTWVGWFLEEGVSL